MASRKEKYKFRRRELEKATDERMNFRKTSVLSANAVSTLEAISGSLDTQSARQG